MNFLFSVPIGRLMFLARYVLTTIVFVVLESALEAATNQLHDSPGVVWAIVIVCVLLMLPIMYYLMRFVVIARLRSIGVSGWWGLLILIPLVNFVFLLFLLFCPADAFAAKSA